MNWPCDGVVGRSARKKTKPGMRWRVPHHAAACPRARSERASSRRTLRRRHQPGVSPVTAASLLVAAGHVGHASAPSGHRVALRGWRRRPDPCPNGEVGVDEIGSSGGILGRSFAGRSKLELISDSQGRTRLLAFFDLDPWRYQLSRSATPRIARKDRQAFNDVPLTRSRSNLPAWVRESAVDSVVER